MCAPKVECADDEECKNNNDADDRSHRRFVCGREEMVGRVKGGLAGGRHVDIIAASLSLVACSKGDNLLSEFFFVQLNRVFDCFDCFLAPLNGVDNDGRWLALEGFVRLEEMLVFLERVFVEVCQILHIFPPLVLDGYGDDFVI